MLVVEIVLRAKGRGRRGRVRYDDGEIVGTIPDLGIVRGKSGLQ
jgi:hypothetical protein